MMTTAKRINTEELAPQFKCDDREFDGLSYKISNIHKGKQHKIGAQADGIDNEDIIEDLSLHTFILQGEVAEDPDDEDIQVGETFWPLQEVYTLTGIFALLEKHQKAVWSIPLGSANTSKLEMSREK